jgi:hypothetical protein
MTSCEIVSDVCTKSLTCAVHTYPRFLWQKCVYNICIYILTKIKIDVYQIRAAVSKRDTAMNISIDDYSR